MSKINREEYEILKELEDDYKWIARDEDISLIAFESEPCKSNYGQYWWVIKSIWKKCYLDEDLFQFIQWEDDEPYNISELIREYESEEKEVKKGIEWLKDEVYKLFPSHDETYNYPDVITVLRTKMLNSVIDLIDQLDEPEVLSDKWIDEYAQGDCDEWEHAIEFSKKMREESEETEVKNTVYSKRTSPEYHKIYWDDYVTDEGYAVKDSFKVYFAAPLFSEPEIQYNAWLVDKIRTEFPDIEVYLPQENMDINDKTQYADSTMIADGDNKHLKEADLLIALLDGPVIDPGVAAEVGYFRALDRPVLGLYTDSRQDANPNIQKITALGDVAENQFHYLNLYVVGLIKNKGHVLISSQALLDTLDEYIDEPEEE